MEDYYNNGNCNPNCCYCAYLASITKSLANITCLLDKIACNINDPNVANIKRMLVQQYPMTVSANYPTIMEDKIIVSTPVSFLDMLNPNMYIIFKIDSNITESNLPVYFKDKYDYPHPIKLNDGVPVLGNQLKINRVYEAYYQQTASTVILKSLTPLYEDVLLANVRV